MKRVQLPSGNTLDVQVADFEPAIALVQAVAGVISVSLSGLKIDPSKVKSVKDLMDQDIGVGDIVAPIMKLLASKEVYELVWPCLLPCLYNGNKIDRMTFQPENARQDFFPVVSEMFKASVLPFIGGLDLSSLTSPTSKSGSQKSK